MSWARSQVGRLTANATSYTDDVTRNIVNSTWSFDSSWTVSYRVPIMGASPYYVQPLSFTLDGTVTGSYDYYDMRWDVIVYDNAENTVWSSAEYNRLGDTITASTLSPSLYDDTDIAYRVKFRMYRNNGQTISRDNLGNFTAIIAVEYDDMEDPPETSPPPFELPGDWVQNTTNTIADKFVPFETVTTPIDDDNVDDSVDEFKEFLEGVQEHETLATVFMGYVSELLRLKGLTPFLCFAICCCTMIAIFELSGG